MSSLTNYLRTLSGLLSEIKMTNRQDQTLPADAAANQAVEMILSLAGNSRKAMLIGNGGSAALASHMQNDLCASVGVRAMVFNEASLLTALANDFGYPTAFRRLVELWADPADLLIAVSSSGKSDNILQAVQAAVDRGCQVITFSGFQPANPLRSLGDLNFYVSSNSYGFVETSHMSLMHALTDFAMATRYAEKKS